MSRQRKNWLSLYTACSTGCAKIMSAIERRVARQRGNKVPLLLKRDTARSVSLADSREADLLWMQQTLGNQAVQQRASTETTAETEPDTEANVSNEPTLPTEPVTTEFTSEVTPTPAPNEPAIETPAAGETPTMTLIVEDSEEEVGPGQMKRSQYLPEVRAEVCRTVEEMLAPTGRSTADCPYLEFVFSFLAHRSAQYIERTLRQFAPEASGVTTARDYIPIITERVRRSTEVWLRTGKITGLPEGVPTTIRTAALAAASEASSPPMGNVLSKEKAGGTKSASNPRAIQAQLGSGRSLESGVRSRMESAFGYDFSRVRVHTGAMAGGLSSSLNARAFTVGEHVAFGVGEYQPGTLIGDALIAHEIAHVVQQRQAGSALNSIQTGESGSGSLEEDADNSAIGAVISLWGKGKRGLANVSRNAMPRLRSGLRLSSCKGAPELKTPTGTSKLKSQTVSTTPADRSRTKLGIGEEVDLSLDPAVAVTWSVTGGGTVNPVAGPSTRFTASQSPSTPKVTATLGTEAVSLDFDVIAPTGMKSTLIRDKPLAAPGPPNNQIGANSEFDCFVQPTSVSFYRARFRENIPGEAYTWPDGTLGNRPATTVAWTPDQANKTTDDVNSALDPIGRLNRGGAFVDFSFSVRVPEELQDDTGTWISWLPNEDHPREYKGSNQKTRVSVVATNTERGGWQGPWQ